MTKIAPPSALSAVTAAALLLAACGSADDASTEASADTVEMPADQALAPVSEAPAADPEATATDADYDRLMARYHRGSFTRQASDCWWAFRERLA